MGVSRSDEAVKSLSNFLHEDSNSFLVEQHLDDIEIALSSRDKKYTIFFSKLSVQLVQNVSRNVYSIPVWDTCRALDILFRLFCRLAPNDEAVPKVMFELLCLLKQEQISPRLDVICHTYLSRILVRGNSKKYQPDDASFTNVLSQMLVMLHLNIKSCIKHEYLQSLDALVINCDGTSNLSKIACMIWQSQSVPKFLTDCCFSENMKVRVMCQHVLAQCYTERYMTPSGIYKLSKALSRLFINREFHSVYDEVDFLNWNFSNFLSNYMTETVKMVNRQGFSHMRYPNLRQIFNYHQNQTPQQLTKCSPLIVYLIYYGLVSQQSSWLITNLCVEMFHHLVKNHIDIPALMQLIDECQLFSLVSMRLESFGASELEQIMKIVKNFNYEIVKDAYLLPA